MPPYKLSRGFGINVVAAGGGKYIIKGRDKKTNILQDKES